MAQQRKNGYLPSDTSIGATLLQTIPLLHEIPEESPEDAIFNFRRGISPATTPVKILLSNDWRMGVALFQPSNVWREEGPVGTLILFSTPCAMNSQSNASTIWQCTNVKMGADASFSCRNLLWKVEKLPLLHSDSTYSISVLNVPGYLFLNDEEDGYRLTWVADRSPDDVCTPSEPILISTIGEDKTILSFERTWERYDSDLRSGERIVPLVAKTSGMEVFCESFVHIQVLLNAILSQRKGMSEEKPSDFLYSLISTTNAGRAAEFIITFIRTQRPGSLGVFVEVDLFSGRYQERNWVKNVSAIDSVALRNWSNALALNQRMKQLRVGPYSVKPNHAFDWSKLCIDSSFDPDSCDDFSPFFWQDYVDSEEAISTRKPPKFISISTLYPDCDLITNKAITDCLPVCYLRGKDSPIEVIYG